MNREEVENKMIQLMLLSLNVSSEVVREYMDNVILKLPGYGGSLETFLNTHNNKHILFHLYKNSARCCACIGKFERGGKILDDDMFGKLYSCVGLPIHAGNCLCIYVAVSHLYLKDVDMTLMFCFLKNCCNYNMSSCICACITKLRQIRNFVCHAKSLTTYTSNHLDQEIDDIVYNILQIAKNVTIDGYEKNIRKQISLIQMGIFKWETVKHAFGVDLHLLMDSGTKQIIKTVEESTKSLKVHTNKIKKDIIKSHKKDINNVKQTIDTHHVKQGNETKQALASLKTDVLKDNLTQSEHLMKEMIDLHDEQSLHLDTVCSSLSENQNSIMSTQRDHTATLSIVEQTTSEIHEKQSKSSKDLSDIRETINVLEPSFEDLATAGKTLKNISVDMPGDIPLVVTYKQLQKDSETQTDIENIKFELGYNTNRMTHEQSNCFQKEKEETEAAKLAGNVEILLQNVLEMKKNHCKCSDILKECKAFIAETCCNKGDHQDQNEAKRRSDVRSKIITETIQMNADLQLSTLLVYAPQILCSLAVFFSQRYRGTLGEFFGLSQSRNVRNICNRFVSVFVELHNQLDTIMNSISTVIRPTEILLILVLNEQSSNSIPESFAECIKPIIKVLSNLKIDCGKIDQIAMKTYEENTVFKDELAEVRDMFFKFQSFYRLFERRIEMVRFLASQMSSLIQRLSSADSILKITIIRTQLFNLYTVVMVVKNMCDCYLQMYRDQTILISFFEKNILWVPERLCSFDYASEVEAAIKHVHILVEIHNHALEQHLKEVLKLESI